MGRRHPVELATQTFPTKDLAVLFFKEMLGRYRSGDRVEDNDGLHLSALLERHDEYRQKVGCGVAHFSVMMTEYGTLCFVINRHDGTSTDFSYRHCISQRPPTRKQEVSQALRRVVRFDLYAARDRFFAENRNEDARVACAETGELISLDEAHMDHRAPLTFEVLVITFLAARGMAVDDVPLTTGQDNQVSPEITDAALGAAFRQYHADVARLDFIKAGVNLGQSARHRVKPCRIRL